MENNYYIKEESLEHKPKFISIEAMENLCAIIETQVCKIKSDRDSNGTGFFCNIPYDDNKLKVLITNSIE